MRKRFASAAVVRRILSLQWGRNFIVAETRQPHIRHGCRHTASMGPQLYRCGNAALIRSSALCSSIASMGPQLYRCGNLKQYVYAWRAVIASMGPQLYRCGNLATYRSLPSPVACFNGAATLSLRKRALGPGCLPEGAPASMGSQLYRCGNNTGAAPQPAHLQGFNGAATLSLRKPA